MRRQGQYTESGVHPMLQQQQQQQQQHPYPPQQLSGNAYSTQDPLWPADSHYGSSWPAEGQWHRDRDSAKDPNNKISSYSTGYTEGQGKAGSHNYMYEAQRVDTKHGTEKVGSTESRAENPNNSALEGGYKDNAALPQTIDALEQRFLQDLTKLLKEQHDAEDAEVLRHRARLNEINTQYQEKLVVLRANQGKIREELMRKESESRLQQYQQNQLTNSMAHLQNNSTPPPRPSGAHHSYPSAGGYNMEATERTAYHGAYGAEGYPSGYGGDAAQRGPYPTQASHYESTGHAHGRGLEPHYAGGRAYNAGGRQR
ncbi:ubiquitin carboxyl-terminal hydrolase isoform X4 [Carex rostrata]